MRKTITASEGHILTDGTVYGKTIHLAESMNDSDFYEITEGEYAAILAKQASALFDEGGLV